MPRVFISYRYSVIDNEETVWFYNSTIIDLAFIPRDDQELDDIRDMLIAHQVDRNCQGLTITSLNLMEDKNASHRND